MSEQPQVSYVYECVVGGETLMVPCPNGCGPSMTMEWITADSGILLGHWLTCPGCRPHGAWSCELCSELIKPDAEVIRAHVVGRHG